MKAVVLAAGEGVRLRPLTLTRPKHLLPVGNIPVLQHVLGSVKKAGISDVLLVVGYLGERIQEALGDGTGLGLRISYVEQRRVGGTGEAISLTEEYTQGEVFAVAYGDLYLKHSAVPRVVQTYRKRKSTVVATVKVADPENYGVVRSDEDGRLVDIVEKPRVPPSNLANAGIYIFTQEIFKELVRVNRSVRGELEVTDAIRQLAKKRGDVHTVKLGEDEWVDIGRPWDLLEANEKFLKGLKTSVKGKVEDKVTFNGDVVVDVGATVRSGVYIEGPIVIGKGSVIGPNCYLRPCTSIGTCVKIGNACEIKNSIIMKGTTVPHFSYVGDSVVGENCNFGAGTLVGNIRLDRRNIRSTIQGDDVDTGRRKLGVIVGDNVQTGINVSFMPGVKVGSNCHIGPNVVVYRDVPADSRVMLRQELEFSKRKAT